MVRDRKRALVSGAELRRKRAKTYTDTADYFRMLRRMLKAAGERLADADPVDLRELVGIEDDLHDAIRRAVAGLRSTGFSWREIGESLNGISGQAAYMRWGREPKPEAS